VSSNGRWATVVIGLLTTVACFTAYENYTKWLPPLQADETGHGLAAARMAFDLRHLALRAFLADTEREMTWPFVHPWVLSGFLLTFGVSTAVGRASSIAFFGAAIVLTHLLARELSREPRAEGDAALDRKEPGAWVGAPSALLMVLNPAFWTQSSQILIEPLGMAVTLSSLMVHAAALRRPSAGRFALAGLLAALTFLTKYNYGFPLIGAFLVQAVVARGAAKPDRRGMAFFLVGLLVPVTAWLADPFPAKLSGLYGFSVNRDEGLRGLDNLLFYPRRIATLSSWPVTFWVLVAVLLSLHGARHKRTCAATLFALLSLAMITVHPNKQERYVFTALPVLYVVGELELGRVARRWLPAPASGVAWAVLLVVLALSLDPRPVLREERDQAQSLRAGQDIVDYIVEHLEPREHTLLLGSCGLLPHLLVQWELAVRKGVFDATVDNLPFPGEQAWDSRYRLGYPAQMTPDYDQRLEIALGSGGYDRVVTLEIAPDSVFLPDWLKRWDAWGQNYVLAMERQTSWQVVAEQAFEASKVRVRIHARPQ